MKNNENASDLTASLPVWQMTQQACGPAVLVKTWQHLLFWTEGTTDTCLGRMFFFVFFSNKFEENPRIKMTLIFLCQFDRFRSSYFEHTKGEKRIEINPLNWCHWQPLWELLFLWWEAFLYSPFVETHPPNAIDILAYAAAEQVKATAV